MVLATMSYAFASQFTKKFLSGTSVVVISTFQLLIGALAGFIGMMLMNPISVGDLASGEVIVGILGLGCLGSGVATLLYFYIMTNGSPEFASTVTYLIPGTAMIAWGFVLLGEPVTHNLILGLMIIFIGVFLSSRKSKKLLTSLPVGTR